MLRFLTAGESHGKALVTILEGVPVLSVNPQPEANSQGLNLPAVTLLTNPADADVLAELAPVVGRASSRGRV